MSSKLYHNTDMLFGLAERLSLLASQDPGAYLDRYRSIMSKVEREEYPMRKGMTQADMILFLLRKGHKLTNKTIMVNHKIAAPWKRISELRNRGHEILSEWKVCPVDGSKYVVYSLEDKKEMA